MDALVFHSYTIHMYLYEIFMFLLCHLYATRMYSEASRMSLACTYVLVCHSYATCMYSHVICMHSILPLIHSYVLVCHSYVTLMYLYVTRKM